MGTYSIQGCHRPCRQRGNVCPNFFGASETNVCCRSYYKALTFYLQEHPTLLNDLLSVMIPRIDHSRVVRMFSKVDHIPLIRSYLIAVQHVRSLPEVVLNLDADI